MVYAHAGPLLKAKASHLAKDIGIDTFMAFNSWLERGKECIITFKRQHGEKQDADDYGAEHWVVDILPTIFTVLKAFSTQMRWQNVYSEENSGLWC